MTGNRLNPVPSAHRTTLLAFGTPFLDGYSTASAAFLIALLPNLSALDVGSFTSSYFVGFFIGSALIGPLADHIGRKWLFAASALLTALFSILPLVTNTFAALLLMRFATGFLLGGDYPVGQALVTENTTGQTRNRSLSLLMLGWYVGALTAVFVAYPIMHFDEVGAEVFLALEALCALLFGLGRCFVSESHSWLLDRKTPPKHKKNAFVTMATFERGHLPAFFFCTFFWLAQTIPATVLMFYSPDILARFSGVDNAYAGVVMLYGAFLLGVLPANLSFFTQRPRAVLLATFLAMAASLAAIAFLGLGNAFWTGLAFLIFATAYGLQSPLDFVYPNLLFPARCRAFFVGIITSFSRVGAMAAAFFFPQLLEHFDVTTLFGAGVVLLLVGFGYALVEAPKTVLNPDPEADASR